MNEIKGVREKVKKGMKECEFGMDEIGGMKGVRERDGRNVLYGWKVRIGMNVMNRNDVMSVKIVMNGICLMNVKFLNGWDR